MEDQLERNARSKAFNNNIWNPEQDDNTNITENTVEL